MDKISRRRFLEDSLALLAVSSLPVPLLAETPRRSGRRIGPNDKIRVAVMGVNSRGMDHVRSYAEMDDVTVAMICDADTAAADRAAYTVMKLGKPLPRAVQDIRQVLDNPDNDPDSMATPNHWHAHGAIWAIQAGKDVYVEKPVSHNVSEGRRIVEAARKHSRICQTGTQSRSSSGLQEAMAYLRAGNLGKVYLARGLCYKRR
jgi:predicted dehydrogenase